MAVQYAKAMGLHVAAINVADDKLALAKEHELRYFPRRVVQAPGLSFVGFF
jgi:propanol-preferring alcohol dehydrogenase